VTESRRTSSEEIALRQRAAEWLEFPVLENLSGEGLKTLSNRAGVDFATAVLFDRFLKSARHGPFIQQIDALRQDTTRFTSLPDTKVVIVPGALYQERPDLGGDGRLVREVAERFGYETALIPLASFGSVTTNVQLLCDWLQAHRHQRMILVSLSKGSADLKQALARPEASEVFHNVLTWVNVCGPLNGTRMANWVLDGRLRSWFFRAKCRWQKRDFDLITELEHAPKAPLAGAVQLPPRMRLLSLVGFPLRRHLTTRHSRFCHRTLARWGPNDGTISLADLLNWPGNIYPVWGADHYFKPRELATELIAAALRHLAAKENCERS